MNENLPKISEVVAVMGLQPTSQNQDEMRFGKKCSLAIHTGEDKFYDHENKIGGGVLDFIVHQDLATDRASAAQWCKSNGLLPHETPAPRTPLRQHVYNDEHGQPVRKAVKYNNGSWSQMRYEGGSWRYGVKGVPDLPYGADRLAQGKSDELVFIFEGEKDCERAWQNGFQATCNVGGAGKWRDGLNATLTGRTVCIVPDNDTAGEDHAHSVKASLQSSGIDCFVLWDYTDDLPHKSDFSDWMDANRDNVEQFFSLAKAAQASQKSELDAAGLHPHFDFLADIELKPQEWLIETVMPTNSLVAIVGASYSGKSLCAIDMCCGIASGSDFHGHKLRQGSVAYIAAEGRSGLLSRVEAWRAANDQQDANLPFALSKSGINLRDPNMVNSIKSLVDKVPDLALLVVDTLNRNFGGGNENQSDAMGEFITACDELADHFDCTVCVVHHMGKDQSAGARGHSSFFAALDAELTFKAIGETDVQLSCTKLKDSPEFDQMQFVKVATLDSVVLEPVAVTKRTDRARLSDNQQIAMDALYEGIGPKLATGTPKLSCRLHLEDWRKIFHKRHSGDNHKTKNDVFARARNALQTKGLIKCDSDYFTLGDKATGGDFG